MNTNSQSQENWKKVTINGLSNKNDNSNCGNTDGGSNAGKEWTEEDKALLLESIKSGLSLNKIAALFSRTVSAISMKLKKHAYDLHIKGVITKEIREVTRLSVEQISKSIARHKSKKRKITELQEKTKYFIDDRIKSSILLTEQNEPILSK